MLGRGIVKSDYKYAILGDKDNNNIKSNLESIGFKVLDKNYDYIFNKDINPIKIMDLNNFDENQIKTELLQTTEDAIEQLIDMRQKEGSKIKVDLENRIEVIKQKIEQISSISAGLVDEYIVKLETRIKELLKTDVVDQTRLAQEVVIYSDKCSVEEEITRLKSHISQFLNLLNENIAIGKKLDFLIQEMNRETNTIGSKANNLEITNLVVDIKTELVNVREQIQNIE